MRLTSRSFICVFLPIKFTILLMYFSPFLVLWGNEETLKNPWAASAFSQSFRLFFVYKEPHLSHSRFAQSARPGTPVSWWNRLPAPQSSASPPWSTPVPVLSLIIRYYQVFPLFRFVENTVLSGIILIWLMYFWCTVNYFDVLERPKGLSNNIHYF